MVACENTMFECVSKYLGAFVAAVQVSEHGENLLSTDLYAALHFLSVIVDM